MTTPEVSEMQKGKAYEDLGDVFLGVFFEAHAARMPHGPEREAHVEQAQAAYAGLLRLHRPHRGDQESTR